MRIISEINDISIIEWDDFVFKNPNGNIFQTNKIYQVYKESNLHTPVSFFAIENDLIVGVLIAVIQKEISGPLGYFTSRCIVSGGPVVLEDRLDIASNLIGMLNKKVSRKAIYTQFRNLFSAQQIKEAFVDNYYVYEPHLDIHIDLNQEPEIYWGNIKSKLRQNIRKAMRNGVRLDVIINHEEIDVAYKILKEVYIKAKIPLPDKSLFFSAFDILKDSNNAIFFKAIKDNEIIGIRFVLLYKHIVYDWYAGSKQENYTDYPNDFLPFSTIEWGMKHKQYSLFDFGGAGKPGVPYGVRDHKMKFSNNLIELGRFERINAPLLYFLIKKAFFVWKKLK